MILSLPPADPVNTLVLDALLRKIENWVGGGGQQCWLTSSNFSYFIVVFILDSGSMRMKLQP